jgi:DNA ligase D-like protein (predicted polymerase)
VAARRPRTAPHPQSAWALASRFLTRRLKTTTASDVLEDGWSFEVAWDAHPVVVTKQGQDVRVVAYDRCEWTAHAQNIVLAVAALPFESLVMEGWLGVQDAEGRPDFEALRRRIATGKGPAPVLLVSDVLWLDGVDLTAAPLPTRRARLPPLSSPLVRSELLEGSLDEVLTRVGALGLPGVIAIAADRTALALSATAAPMALNRSLSQPPKVTNPAKVLFPRDGLTKADVVAWYREVAPVLLPHLRDRPVVAQRWPDGIDDFTWYQHRPPPRAPDFLHAVTVDDDRRLLVQNADALLWLVNQAALTFHPWSTRTQSLLHPDWASIDLDPGTRTGWPQVVETAVAIRALLEVLEVPSVVKTSGQKGLHVLVPLAPGQSFIEAQRFAAGVCGVVAKLLPESVCLTHDEAQRKGRLFLDHLQNFRGKTLVAPYALRAVDGCPVSTPLRWDEVTPSLEPKSFTRAAVLERLARHGDLFAPVLEDGVVLAPLLTRLS